MWVYINYPNSKFTIHRDPHCPAIRMREKENQRIINIESGNVNSILHDFRNQRFKFQSKAELNDMWVEINLNSEAEELDTIKQIKQSLGSIYKPFRQADLTYHC